MFAVTLNDHSMEPRFERGIFLVAEPKTEYSHNDFIIAKLEKFNTSIFRQLQIENNVWKLSPLNREMFKDIILTEKDCIQGVIVQTICNYKRD